MKLKKEIAPFLLLSMLVSLLVACGNGTQDGGDTTVGQTSGNATTGDNAPVRKPFQSVVLIGVDGAGHEFSKSHTPKTWEIFYGKGATTSRALTANPTISAECWGTMLTGVSPFRHGFTNDSISSMPSETRADIPTVFSLIRQERKDATLVSYTNWSPINTGIIEDGIGIEKSGGNDAALRDQAVAYITEKGLPTFMFVAFDDVDHQMHETGFGSAQYYQKLKEADGYIGEIYEAIKAKGLLEETLFLVTADHGGTGTSHGGLTDSEKYVFFGAVGATVNATSTLEVRVIDTPIIVTYGLGIEARGPLWECYLPQGMFTDCMTPEKLPYEDIPKEGVTPTPDKDGADGIGKYLDSSKIKGMLTFDGDLKSAVGSLSAKNSGTLTYEDGIHGQAVHVSSKGFVRCPNLQFGTDSFSIALWVKLEKTIPNGAPDDPAIYSNKNWQSGANAGFILSARADDLKFNAGNNGGRTDHVYNYPDSYEEEWFHTLLVVDRAKSTVSLYINFKLVSTEAIADSFTPSDSFDGMKGQSFNLGNDGTGNLQYRLDAKLDDLILYGDAMTAEQVTKLADYYY